MKKLLVIMSAGVCFLGLASVAMAQPDAVAKMRGYPNYHSGRTYRSHAGNHARVLHHYGRKYKSVPKDVAQKETAAIRRNLDSAKKELAELKKNTAGNKAAQEHVKQLDKHYTKCNELCKMLETESAKAETDSVKICECCMGIYKELKAAEGVEEKLRKELKFDEIDEEIGEPETEEAK